jgi:ribonuclease P protein subunit RPR2
MVDERVERLMEMAEENASANPERARSWTGLAFRMCTRYRVRMPSGMKPKFCRKCFTVFVPGVNCTVRLKPGKNARVIKCFKCGNISREFFQRRPERIKTAKTKIK